MIESTGTPARAAETHQDAIQQKRLKESCQDFEAVLVGFLFKAMRQTVPRSDEPDRATELYESMMDDAVAQGLSRQGKVGLSDMLYQSLAPQAKKKQEKG